MKPIINIAALLLVVILHMDGMAHPEALGLGLGPRNLHLTSTLSSSPTNPHFGQNYNHFSPQPSFLFGKSSHNRGPLAGAFGSQKKSSDWPLDMDDLGLEFP